MRADHLLLGYCELRVKAAHAACFLNLCHERGYVYIPLRSVKKVQTGDDLICRFRLSVMRPLLDACNQRGIEACVLRRGGLPVLLYRYRRRAGLAVGALLAALMLWLASSVVWDVRIESDGELRVPRLRQELAACGLSVGSWIPTLETDDVESRLLTSSEGVAWVSVNMRGTVAYVQVRQLLNPQEVASDEATPGDAVNLVASCDGIVESVNLMSGEVVVKPGDLVRKGQLLISGVRDHGEETYDVMEARGAVFARTEHTLAIRIPLVNEQKVYTGQKNVQKTLFFFGKAIKVTKSTGIIEGNCDTIKKLEIFSLFGDAALPVSMETIETRPYELQQIVLSKEEAIERAYEELGRALTLATRDATLLSKSVVCEVTDECCLITCTYRCVENIAEPLPFSTDGTESVS